MAFYNENGSYAYDYRDPDYNGIKVASRSLRALPEQHCPRIFWSNETIFLNELHKEIGNLIKAELLNCKGRSIMNPSKPDDWSSPEFPSLTVLSLYVYSRLIHSADLDAEDAGFDYWSLRDYYVNNRPD